MQTQLADFIRKTPEGEEAEAILRACVHCGFCTATCPTYQLVGDELDGPRGRIYLIKQVLEGEAVGRATQRHLDRCLTCRACETTCPSGVEYGRLADIGRQVVEVRVGRPRREALFRCALRWTLPYRRRVRMILAMARLLRPLLPAAMQAKIPPARTAGAWPPPRHSRRMLVLEGCVQPAMAPDINAAAARVLDRLGISLLPVKESGCCGALSYHLSARDEGLDFMRRNIDAWWPLIEAGAEAIVVTASGCGVLVKDYGHLLRHDPSYREKAEKVSAITRDIAEVVAGCEVSLLPEAGRGRRIAFHSPCTLQHGQRLDGVVEAVLRRLGFELTPVADAHLCCGSAGAYSLLERDLSAQLLARKVESLAAGNPHWVATANIGCLAHLQSAGRLPVMHWIELLDRVAT